MVILKKEIMSFLIALRFYLYTDGDEKGMSKKERSDTLKKISAFNENIEEWLESNYLFNLRLFNILKCLRVLLNKNPEKKYMEEVILDRDIEFLQKYPVQELIYRTHNLRKIIINEDNDLIKNFSILIETLSELFIYLKTNPSDARIYFAIIIDLISQVDRFYNKKADMDSDINNKIQLIYFAETYRAVYDNKEEKLYILKLIDNIKEEMNNIVKLFRNTNKKNIYIGKKIEESQKLVRNILSGQVANFQLNENLPLREMDNGLSL